jgi:hypothetical protein
MAITVDNRYLFTSDPWDFEIKQFRVSDGRMIKHYGGLIHIGIDRVITTPDDKYLFF